MARVLPVLAVSLLLLLVPLGADAQREYDVWHFGQRFSVDFRGGAPVIAPGSAIWTSEGSAVMCDRTTGALLFYTDGVTVFDNRNAVMPNGAGLNGHISGAQSAVVVPMPGNNSKYYIFTADNEGYAAPNRGIHYSIVDMTRNGGRGDVTTKNVLVRTSTSEKLTAIPHSNGTDYWVLVHSLGGNTFYAYQVSAAGVSAAPVASSVGVSQGNPPGGGVWTVGYLKSSPDGRKLVSACEGPGLVELFDFSPCSGVVSNPIQLNGNPRDVPYGVTFSPDNTKLYVAYLLQLHQYDLTRYDSASIVATRTAINDPANPAGGEVLGAMQIGPDGKIYVVANSNWLGVINNPNALGQACNYVVRHLRLTTVRNAFWLGLPNNMDARSQGGAPPPGVIITPSGPLTFCDGDSVRLSAPAGYRSYRWSTGDTTLSTIARRDGTYSVTVTDNNGCTELGTIAVKVNPIPKPSITATGPSPLCQGDSVTLRASAGFVSYRWSNGAATQSITVGATGRYTVIVTDTNGCRGSAFSDVQVLPRPVPVITGPERFCFGDSVVLDAGAGYTSYQWSNGAIGRSITVDGSGTYRVRVVDGNGCTAESAPFTVTEHPRTDATIVPQTPLVFCEGDSALLGSVPGHRSYRWSTGETGRTIAVRTAGRYTLTVIDTNGCTASDSIDVTVNPRPVAVVTPDGSLTFCEGDSVILDAGSGFASYRWSTGEIARRIVVRESGSYSVAVASDQGCSDTSDPVTVTVAPLPDAVINGPAAVCPNALATYGASPIPGASYRWSIAGPGTIVSGDGTPEISIRWGASGKGEVTLSITSSLGCSASSKRSVTIGNQLVPTITSDRSPRLCSGDTVTLDAGVYRSYRWSTGETTRTIRVHEPGIYTVAVDDSGGCSGASEPMIVEIIPDPTPKIIAPDGATLCQGDSILLDAGPGYMRYLWSNGARTRTIMVRESGSYTVRVTDSSGCAGTSEPIAVVVRQKPEPSITGARIVCRNSSATYAAADVPGNRYAWSVSGGTIVAGDGTSQVTVAWGNGPVGSVSLTETIESLGCSADAAMLRVDIGDSLRPTITPSDSTTLCEGSTTTLDAGAGYASYLWSNGATTRSITVSDSGTYTITVTSIEGCSGTAMAYVSFKRRPEPRVWPSGAVAICAGDSVRLEAPAGYAAYRWSTGEEGMSIVVRAPGLYTVEVTDNDGCTGRSEGVAVDVRNGPEKPAIAHRIDGLESTPAARYQWMRDGAEIPGAVEQLLRDPIPGAYRVMVADTLGCTAISDPYIIPIPSEQRHVVRLDTIYAVVGDRALLTMRIDPPLRNGEMVNGYRITLHLDPRALYPHGVISPDRDERGELATMQGARDGEITITRPASSPLSGDILFQLEVEGLITGQPLNAVVIDDVVTQSAPLLERGGNGLVILSGCAIAHSTGVRKTITIESVSPAPASHELRVEYSAVPGSSPALRLFDGRGAEVLTLQLEQGSTERREAIVDVAALPAGVYLLELRDGAERSAIPIIIRR